MKGTKGLVGLNEFLGLSKNKLQRLQSAPHSVAHVVMGNEASDMDSMVSSALHAYFRSFCPLVPSPGIISGLSPVSCILKYMSSIR